jgi:two-component system chemotaxis sensor kinase CheA
MELQQDPELFATFLDETEESLASVGALFVELERDPGERSTVEAIFRPIHSLKGNSAFFGLLNVKRLAHEMESVLDLIRKGRRSADQQAVSNLLAALDLLVAMIAQVRAGGSDDNPAALEPLSRRLAALIPGEGEEPLAKDLDLLDQMVPAQGPAREALNRLRRHLGVGALVTANSSPSLLDDLLRRAEGGPLPDADLAVLLAELKRCQDEAPDPECRSAIKDTVDGVQIFTSAMGFELVAAQYVRERLQHLPWLWGRAPTPTADAMTVAQMGAPATSEDTALEALVAPPGATPAPARSDSEVHRRERTESIRSDGAKGDNPKSDSHRADAQGGKSMRVAESTIDTFLHYVGELVVVGDLFRHLQIRVAGTPGMQMLSRDFRRANETFSGLSNQLQTSIMAIRRVPVRPVAQKIPRLVRDVAEAAGKDVEAVVDGVGVMVDKSHLERLDAPLTHIIRNSVDHGIEAPEDRIAAGKPRHGTVTVTFAETGSAVFITIADDGRGINLAAIRRKAEQMGLVAAGVPMTEAETLDLIFASGLSTAAKVTDISGRGVGMDVVKRTIEEAGGTITVTTQPGKGSEFRLRLPRGVATQIVGGYLVRAGGAAWVLPLDRVRETFRARPEDRQAISGVGHCLMRRGQVLPLEELSDVLMGRSEAWPDRGLPVVVVESDRRRVALAVSAVLGVQKVVIRHLAGLPPGAPMITGAALLGDGHLALVIDPDQLYAVAS